MAYLLGRCHPRKQQPPGLFYEIFVRHVCCPPPYCHRPSSPIGAGRAPSASPFRYMDFDSSTWLWHRNSSYLLFAFFQPTRPGTSSKFRPFALVADSSGGLRPSSAIVRSHDIDPGGAPVLLPAATASPHARCELCHLVGSCISLSYTDALPIALRLLLRAPAASRCSPHSVRPGRVPH